MANKTVHNFTIKLREDRVYDLYLDGKWIVKLCTVLFAIIILLS